MCSWKLLQSPAMGTFFSLGNKHMPIWTPVSFCAHNLISWTKHTDGLFPVSHPSLGCRGWEDTQKPREQHHSHTQGIWVLEASLVHKIMAFGWTVFPAMGSESPHGCKQKQQAFFSRCILHEGWTQRQLKSVSSYALISPNWLKKTAHSIICVSSRSVLSETSWWMGTGWYFCTCALSSLWTKGDCIRLFITGNYTGAYQRFFLHSAFPVSFCKCMWSDEFLSFLGYWARVTKPIPKTEKVRNKTHEWIHVNPCSTCQGQNLHTCTLAIFSSTAPNIPSLVSEFRLP